MENKSSEIVLITKDELDFKECIGKGSRGSVFRAYWKGKECAVKQVLEDIEKEAKLLSQLSHDNIITFLGASIEFRDAFLVTELAKYGSLYHYLRDRELSFDKIVKWALHIARACQYLHQDAPIKIVHRDLKSMNVLVCDGDTVKLCDFGSSHEYYQTTLMSFVGTASWMAPEVIRNEPISDRSDIYSFGVILWEMLTREIPFADMSPMSVMWLVASQKKRLPIPSKCPQPFSELMESCWYEKPTDRPSAKTVIQLLQRMLKQINLPKETQTFIGTRNNWKSEIMDQMASLRQMDDQLHRREVQVKKREEELRKKERELLTRQTKLEQMSVSMELRKRTSSSSNAETLLNTWSEHRVAEWLMDQNLHIYVSLFLENNINGRILTLLTEQELENIGVKSFGHRKIIIEGISKLLYTLDYPNLPSATYLPSPSNTVSTNSSPYSSTSSLPGSNFSSPNNSNQRRDTSTNNLNLSQKKLSIDVNINVYYRKFTQIPLKWIIGVTADSEGYINSLSQLNLFDSSTPTSTTNTLSSNSSTGSNGSTGSGSGNNNGNNIGSKGRKVSQNNPICDATNYFIERVVFYYPGENVFGHLVTDFPFECQPTGDVKFGSDVVIEIHFDRKKFKKFTSKIRLKISQPEGSIQSRVSLKEKGQQHR